MSLSGPAYRRLVRELTQLQGSPPEGIRVILDDSDISNVVGWIEGPPGTPYEGGYFRIKFQFSESFPNSPPKCWFATKIFHPNVAPSTGEICVSTLKKDWKKEYGVGHILITIKCLLIHPNPESALHEEAGKLLLEAYNDYARHARLMTDVHARHRPAEFTNTQSSTSYQPYASSSIAPTSSVTSAHASGKLPSTTSASAAVTPLQASSNSNGDATMLVDASTASSAAMKPVSSSTGSISSTSATSVVPKKRAAPIPAGPATLSSSTNIQYTGLPLQSDKPFGVLGASTAGASASNSALKKPASAAGGATAQAAKKRGLKRL